MHENRERCQANTRTPVVPPAQSAPSSHALTQAGPLLTATHPLVTLHSPFSQRRLTLNPVPAPLHVCCTQSDGLKLALPTGTLLGLPAAPTVTGSTKGPVSPMWAGNLPSLERCSSVHPRPRPCLSLLSLFSLIQGPSHEIGLSCHGPAPADGRRNAPRPS